MVISAPRRCWTPPWFGAEARRAAAAGLAVVAATLAAGWPYWRSHGVAAALTLLSCGGLAVVGMLLVGDRRTRRTGALFVFASAAWALNWLSSWNAGAGPILSPYAQAGFYLALGIGVLLYPSGRLEYLPDRIWTVLAFVILLGGPTGLWLTSKPEWAAFKPDVWWPAPLVDRGAFRLIMQISGVAYLVLALAFAVVLLFRLSRMGRMRRIVALPVTLALAILGILAAVTQRPVMTDTISLEELLNVYAVQGGVALLVPLTLLASGLRTRIAELTVAGRMLRLTAPVSVERVRDALRDVLHDPTMELWFWAPLEQVYVDAEGRAMPVPSEGDPAEIGMAGGDAADPVAAADSDGSRWRRKVLGATGEPLAIVELGGVLRDHVSLVDAALAAGGRALETARLQATVQANLEQVRSAYERLVRAEAVERERLARDLHDGAQQRLLALGAMLGALEAASRDPAVREHARTCRLELVSALGELRSLAREVQPALLVQDGIGPALEVAAERIGTRIRLDVTDARFPKEIESTLYSVLCEMLSYAVDRARASQVSVRVSPVGNGLIAEVSDDGDHPGDPAAELNGLSGRIRALRGHMEVDGDPVRGTTIRMVLPCE